jgi:hypothetical protein
MSEQLAVIGGLGVTSFLFAYFSFSLRESQEEFWQRVSVGLFLMALVFTNFVMGAVLLIVQNGGVSYFDADFITWGLVITTWTTVIVLFFFFGWVVWATLKMLYEKIVGQPMDRARYD